LPVSDAEQPRKRKLLRRHSAPTAAPANNQTSGVADSADSVPPVISNLLMVEVENVAHDVYKTTEEMKVSLSMTFPSFITALLCCILPRDAVGHLDVICTILWYYAAMANHVVKFLSFSRSPIIIVFSELNLIPKFNVTPLVGIERLASFFQ